jgi:hypothetical protein
MAYDLSNLVRMSLIRHVRYFVLQLAESYLTEPLFEQILGCISGSRGTPHDHKLPRSECEEEFMAVRRA